MILVLCLVAVAPWLVGTCSPRPLMPQQLRDERNQYQTRVAAAQEATADYQRRATSPPPKVIPIGTVAQVVGVATNTAFTITPALTPIDDSAAALPATPDVSVVPTVATATLEAAAIAAQSAKSTVRILTSTLVTQTVTPTAGIVVVRSTPLPVATSAPTVTGTVPETMPAPVAVARQSDLSGMVEVEDIITEANLTDRAQQGIEGDSIAGLAIGITAEGLSVQGEAVIVGAVRRPFEMSGTFAVENESLVVKVVSILLDGQDVTEQYRSQLEESIRWELYRLLPQRYVQSYVLTDGQILVRSLKRQ